MVDGVFYCGRASEERPGEKRGSGSDNLPPFLVGPNFNNLFFSWCFGHSASFQVYLPLVADPEALQFQFPAPHLARCFPVSYFSLIDKTQSTSDCSKFFREAKSGPINEAVVALLQHSSESPQMIDACTPPQIGRSVLVYIYYSQRKEPDEMNTRVANVIVIELGILIAIMAWLAISRVPSHAGNGRARGGPISALQ
jgi:hypothetical protein